MAVSDPITLSVTTLAVSTSLGAFYQMLPPISEVRKRSASEPDFAADVRMGELMASAITLSIGGIASSLSGSPLPALVSALFAMSLIGMYEMTLRSDGGLTNG